MIRRARLLGALLLGVLLLSSCRPTSTVARRHDGQTYEGRRVSALAYAWYARGLRHEHAAEFPAAENAYLRATEADPESGSAWAARGRCACRESLERALPVFAEGLESAAERAPLYIERGYCELAAGRNDDALADAQRAVVSAPTSSQATRLLAGVWAARGEPEQARLVELAWSQWTAARGQPGPQAMAPEPSLQVLDRAIRLGNRDEARALATGLVPPGELSLRYYALGQPAWASEQAALVLRAEPQQSDAELTRWLLESPPNAAPPGLSKPLSTLGVLLFAERLGQLVGPDAAQLFLRGVGPLEPRDELEASVSARLPGLARATSTYF